MYNNENTECLVTSIGFCCLPYYNLGMTTPSRPRVYIAGPMSKGSLAGNVNQGVVAFLALADAGFAPFCPMLHVYVRECVPALDAFGLDNPNAVWVQGKKSPVRPEEYDYWLGIDKSWLSVSDALLRLPGESWGADQEIEFARGKGIPVFYDIKCLSRHFWESEKCTQP